MASFSPHSPLHLPESLFLRALTEIKPYQSTGKNKKDEVELMFDKISGSYDLLNKVLSLGIDRQWRKKALSMLIPCHPRDVLDVATGTGDLAFMAESILKPESITGLDLSAGMLEIANKRLKIRKSGTKITFLKVMLKHFLSRGSNLMQLQSPLAFGTLPICNLA